MPLAPPAAFWPLLCLDGGPTIREKDRSRRDSDSLRPELILPLSATARAPVAGSPPALASARSHPAEEIAYLAWEAQSRSLLERLGLGMG